jgi:hypothetical protein
MGKIFLIVVLLLAGLPPTPTAFASESPAELLFSMRLANLRPLTQTAVFTPRPASPDALHPQPVQLPACSAPGAQRCVNGWVWWCQCYSFGCHWTTGSARC